MSVRSLKKLLKEKKKSAASSGWQSEENTEASSPDRRKYPKGGKGGDGGKGKSKGKGKDSNKGKKGKDAQKRTSTDTWNQTGPPSAKALKEMKAMAKNKDGITAKRCKIWNTSDGCRYGSTCKFAHECWECGNKGHKFCDVHFRG